MNFITVQGHRLEYRWLRTTAEAPTIVFLHEGLGSVGLWRDFPHRIVQATGCNALVYSRYGYGHSDPLTEPRQPSYMHEEALKALPELLDKLDVSRPLLLGHSDGGSIALLHAAAAQRPLAGIIVMAPHVMVEAVTIDSVQAARRAYETAGLREKLGRYHADIDAVFRPWIEIWLDPAFRDWNIEACLPAITCPVLAIQGEQDEFGTMAQIDRIQALAPDVELLKLADCRHSPHRDQPEAVITAITRFVASRPGGWAVQDTRRQ